MIKGRLIGLCLTLIIGGKTFAQTATVPGLYPNTNVIRSYVTGFSQGVCNDGTNTYFFGTTFIQQRNGNYQYAGGLVCDSTTILNGLSGFNILHLGDPDYFQGYLYAPMEASVGTPQGAVNVDVAIFTASNLVRCSAISISNYQSEASAVCVDPNFSNSTALFVTSWASANTNDGIYQYKLDNFTNLTFVRALPLSRTLRLIQGITCIGGMLYVITDDGPYGDVYQVNPTNGAVVFLVQLAIAGNTEWEGLDYYHGFLVAAEASTGTVNFYDFFNANRRINGWVRDNRNNFIRGVGLIASAIINGTNLTVTTDTDTNGNFALNVPPGNWNITVNAAGGADSLANLGNYLSPAVETIAVANGDIVNNIVVTNCSLYITAPAAFPAGEIGVAYNQTLQASSCNPVFTWNLAGGSLPAGLTLSPSGILFGTPAGSGVFNFNAQVADGKG